MEREISRDRSSIEPSAPGVFERLLGGFKARYLPVLLTYFCYGASGVTNIALVFFEKDTLKLTPAEVAGIAFWLGLPWSMKMVAGAAYPIFGKRRAPYFIDTTISAPLAQLTMVPMLVLIAKTAPPGAEATMFAIMASLMNLALSASEIFTRYLNDFFAVTLQDYSRLGELMITIGIIGLLPLLALPLLQKIERAGIQRRGGETPA